MIVTWLGTASLLFENAGRKILFDPYLRSFNPALSPFPLEDIGDVEAIFITHPHFDHFADMPVVMAHCAAPVYVCERGIELGRRMGFDVGRMRPIQAGDVVHAGGMEVRAWQGCHCEFDRAVVEGAVHRALHPGHLRDGLALEGQNHRFRIDAHRDVLGYQVSAEGRTAFLLGSANCREDVSYPEGMDLLIYPYQGRGDMAAYSLPFLGRFKPHGVMLDHFDDAFPPVTARMDCGAFIRAAAERYPEIEVFEPEEHGQCSV